jgi:hypothetical protein
MMGIGGGELLVIGAICAVLGAGLVAFVGVVWLLMRKTKR